MNVVAVVALAVAVLVVPVQRVDAGVSTPLDVIAAVCVGGLELHFFFWRNWRFNLRARDHDFCPLEH